MNYLRIATLCCDPRSNADAIEFGSDAALRKGYLPDNSVLSKRIWVLAIENSFDAKPHHCPDCAKRMQLTVVYPYSARKTIEGEAYLSKWIPSSKGSSALIIFELFFLNFESY